MASLISNLENLYNESPGESWGEYFAKLDEPLNANQAPQETPVSDIRRTSEFYEIESQELWRRLGDPSLN